MKKRILIMLAPFILVILSTNVYADSPVLFEEAFSDNSADWETFNDGDSIFSDIVNGEYQISITERNGWIIGPGLNDWSKAPIFSGDYELEITVSRVTSADENYCLSLLFDLQRNYEDFKSLFICRNGDWSFSHGDNFQKGYYQAIDFLDGGVYQIKVQRIGGSYTFYVDDRQIGKVEGIDVVEGSIGFGLRRYFTDTLLTASASFDNLIVRETESVNPTESSTRLQSTTTVTSSDEVVSSLTKTVVAQNFDIAFQIPDSWISGANSPFNFGASNNQSGNDEVAIFIDFNRQTMIGIDSEQEAANAIFSQGQGGKSRISSFEPVSINGEPFFLGEILTNNEQVGIAAIRFMREGYYIAITAAGVTASTWTRNAELIHAIMSTISLATADEFNADVRRIDSTKTLSDVQSVEGFSLSLPRNTRITGADLFSLPSVAAGVGTPYNLSTPDSLGLRGVTTLRLWRFSNNLSRYLNSLQLASVYTLTTSDLNFEYVAIGDTPALLMTIQGTPNVYGVFVNVSGLNFAVILEAQDNISSDTQDLINQIAQSIIIP